MIDLGAGLPDAGRGGYERRRETRDTTRTYVRLAQQRADRGEPLDGNVAPAPAQGGLWGLVRRLWPHHSAR
jgi:hypothetical protein